MRKASWAYRANWATASTGPAWANRARWLTGCKGYLRPTQRFVQVDGFKKRLVRPDQPDDPPENGLGIGRI